MELSDDALAIVASNLTAAHCALSGPYRPKTEEPGDTVLAAVEDLFRTYYRRVRASDLNHRNPPA